MKSLFEEINSWNVEDDFEIKFKILNLGKGWAIVNSLETDKITKNKLVRFVALAYSYDSPLLQKRKDRGETKQYISQFLELKTTDYVIDCIRNKNSFFNAFITWYLRQSEDRDFSLIISGEELYYSLLETAREGVDVTVTADDEKKAERVMKAFTRMEVVLKADAYKRAMEIKASIESQTRTLQKNYESLYKTVQDEIPEIGEKGGWAEKSVLKWKFKNKK